MALRAASCIAARRIRLGDRDGSAAATRRNRSPDVREMAGAPAQKENGRFTYGRDEECTNSRFYGHHEPRPEPVHTGPTLLRPWRGDM